ncbi:MAG: MBL fold metallo-hydrolase [Candidatus Lokiarchaeota archaeon]|nr:MBL fold metallo-hydrolase [Candidatus Lokiarchaeota archaeon]
MFKFSTSKEWFEIIKHKDYLYIIRDRLDEIDPRFYTTYTNLYLLIGSHSALLIDTGCGLFPLKPIIDNIILDKTLLVINTHSHFDHICGNYEFNNVMIHKKERRQISKPRDIAFLRDSPKEIIKRYESSGFIVPPVKEIRPVIDNQVIELGNLYVKIIHTPGHSPGSISLLTNKNELFTGDTAHYGMMYLIKATFPIFLSSISKLLELYQKSVNLEIYPSHEEFAVGKDLLVNLSNGVKNIENIWETRKRDNFLEAWVLSDENFKYAVF